MVLVLDHGRPRARSHPLLETLTAWVAERRARRAQREALAYLLELDAYRLDDLGINRADLFAALGDRVQPTRLVAERREWRFHRF